MNEVEQKQWISEHGTEYEEFPYYYGDASLAQWEEIAELVGFDTESYSPKEEKELFKQEGVKCFEELSDDAKIKVEEALEKAYKDYLKKHALLIFKHIEGVN